VKNNFLKNYLPTKPEKKKALISKQSFWSLAPRVTNDYRIDPERINSTRTSYANSYNLLADCLEINALLANLL